MRIYSCRLPLKRFLPATLLCAASLSVAQEATRPPSSPQTELIDTVRDLKEQVQQLRTAIEELRAERHQYETELMSLRREVNSEDRMLPSSESAPTMMPVTAQDLTPGGNQPLSPGVTERLNRLDEQYQLLTGNISEIAQTRVESASRYRVRLSGLAVFNLFTTRGTTDSFDLPLLAEPAAPGAGRSSLGATLRQSQIGLEVTGPTWAGAHISGDLHFDFAGGFPDTQNGMSFGVARLRTGTIRLAWPKTSITVGQDTPFFSPLSPTSLATLASPALSYSGNLWAWLPQVRVEHRMTISDRSSLLAQFGIFDSLTGESASGFDRGPTAGEGSGQPAYAARIAWTHTIAGLPMTLGTAAYYARQNWGANRAADSWLSSADWTVPLGPWFTLTGEFYRGRALGGISGGLEQSVVFSGPPADLASRMRGLDSMGGWGQMKFKPAANWEFNAAAGQENPFASEFRAFPFPQNGGDPGEIRNRSALLNVIYRPRSDLLFSAEYHHIQTFRTGNDSQSADHLNLVMGILF